MDCKISDLMYVEKIGSWEYDLLSRQGNYSPELYNIFGLKDEAQFDPETLLSIIIKEDHKKVIASLNSLITDSYAGSASVTYRILKNSETRVLYTNAKVLKDKNGKAYKITGSTQDITETISSSENEIKNLENFTAAFDFSPGLVSLNSMTDGRFIYINQNCCKVIGLSREKIIHKKISHLDVWIDETEREEYERMLNEHGKVENFVVKLRDISEKMHWLLSSAEIITLNNEQYLLTNSVDITEQKKNELKSNAMNIQINENDRRFEDILNNIPFAYSRVNKDGKWQYANRKWLQMYDVSFNELKGKFYDYIYPDYAKEKSNEQLNEALAGKIVSGETSRVKKNERIEYLSYQLIPVFNNGEVIGVDQYIIDITELKKTEESLRASREKYRIIRENIPVVVYSLIPGRESTGIFISGRVEELTGYNYLEFYDDISLWQNIQYENDREYISSKIYEHRLNKTQLNIEYRIKTKSNEIKWVRDVATPLVDDRNNIERVNGFLEDISKRKNAEKALKMSEVKYRSLFVDSKDCIYITSAHGQIIDINPAGLDLFGYSREEMLMMNAALLYENFADRFRFQRILEEKGFVKDYQVRLKRKNGEIRICILTTSGNKNEKGEIRGYQGIVRDITESKMAEKELVDAKERAEKADRLKTEFLAQMSHEIRTPINTILSFSSLIKSEFAEKVPANVKEYFTILDRAGKRIIRTIDLILNMAEIQTGSFNPNLERVDITSVIIYLYTEYKSLAKDKSLELKLNIPDKNIYIMADEYSTTQIISNLIDNAIKYTSCGEVNIAINIECNKVHLSVSDTGIGISNEYLPEIFSTFTQEEQGYTRKFEGSGLGLALVKQYCRLNNADIFVESKKGKGTKFTVVFSNSLSGNN